MEADINEVIDYYAKANASFLGIFTSTVPPDSRHTGGTNPIGGGIIIPLAGSACFTLEGTPYAMKPGMVVHAGPDMHLDREVLGDETWRFAVIHYHIPKDEVRKFPFYQTHFSFSTGENAKIPDLIQQLLLSQSTPGAGALFRTKFLFTNLLAEFFDSAKRQLANSDTILVEQIMTYIRQNYAEPITIAKTASYFGLDRRRLALLFERHVGMTPSNYLIQCRILKAKEMLHTCTCSVKQIAECVGYSDSLYFSKAFKKQIGVSPSDFRERMKHSV